LTACDASSTRRRFVYILKNTPRIFQEQFPSRTQFHSARQTLEKLEAHFPFQILNLPGKSRLRYVQPPRGTPVMLVLADCHEIPQMPQFHPIPPGY
jgi:hypothetical protein